MEFAFNFEDLGRHFVMEDADFSGISNLDNDVHPLFKRDHFRLASLEHESKLLLKNDPTFDVSAQRLNEEIYQRILPGLRLATLFFEHSGPFFSQVLQGELEPRKVKRLNIWGEVENWTVQWVNVIEEVRFSQTLIAMQRDYFAQHLAENTLFYFDDALEDHWAEARPSYRERCRYTIGMGKNISRLFCEAPWHQTKAQTRCFMNFQLATTLIHELAHVAWYYRWWDYRLLRHPDHKEEAICSHDEVQIELGQSWETWFFKGCLRPMTLEHPPRWVGYTWAPFTRDCENTEAVTYPDTTHACSAVPAYSINQFFQKERWESHTDQSQPFTLDFTPLSSLSCDCWFQDIEQSYMNRLTINHESQTNSRRQFPE
jgi:hypothetical protein